MIYLLAALFALAPTYQLRFQAFGLPLNILEVLIVVFWIAFAIWLVRLKRVADFKKFLLDQPRFFFAAIVLFFLAGLLSFYISPAGGTRAAGLFTVLFLQPILTYFPAKYLLQSEANKRIMLNTIFLSIAVLSLYGILQYFTKIGLPVAWWGNPVEPKRSLSVFNHPNAFAMFLGPALAFTMPFVFSKITKTKEKAYELICYALGIFAFVLTLSRSAWIGFLAVIATFGLLSKDRRIRIATLLVLLGFVITVFSVPKLNDRVMITFQGDKATLSRFSLWKTSWSMIENSPILGQGLYSFKTLYNDYNLDSLTEAYNYPHNIFLNFWVETGLLGLLSFLAICAYLAWYGLKDARNLYNLGLLLFLVALLVHGQFDHPYLKNDLALYFWLIAALRK
jgi:putative inorganic carbon (hco3(-)) transporter